MEQKKEKTEKEDNKKKNEYILNNKLTNQEILLNKIESNNKFIPLNNKNIVREEQSQNMKITNKKDYNSINNISQNSTMNNNENLYMNKTNINTNYNNYENEKEKDEFLKIVINLIKDQQGCRLIQKKIDENWEISNNLFDVLYPEILSMSKDLFGNYVIQKILENVKSIYLIKFIDLISKDFYNLSISIYGTRVVQKILEIVSRHNYNKDKEIYEQCFQKINDYITNNIVALSSNSNSSHIIIKYVNEIKYPQNIQLYSEVFNNFVSLCKNKHGCCVIQKCIEFGTEEQKNKLYELSKLNCCNLISDQFGNYVIQFVIGLNIGIINSKVLEILKKDLIHLCKEKYASNVIEKFLVNKSKESMEIINILLKNENYLHELILDPFGNYIIQRILSLIEGENRYNLIKYIVKSYPEIRSLPFGPRLISKLHERFKDFTLLVQQNYGWETTQEFLSYIHNNNNNQLNIKNNLMMNNNSINGMYYMNNMNMINNINNRIPNYNNNFMNFQNRNNVGNINFIQMNNYMLTNGQSNLRMPMYGLGGGLNNINPLNNMNNPKFFPNFGNLNNINNNMKNNINNQINNNLNNNVFQRFDLYGLNNNPNINNNFLNNGQNMINYNQFLNANLIKDKNDY